jgi:HAD superfamily hydrolase (TIGR01509 family)
VTRPDAIVRAVTVDLDDTLFAQEEWLAGAWLAVSDRGGTLGLDGAALRGELARVAALGTDRGAIIDQALVAIGVQPQPYVQALVSAFSGHAPERLAPYPGAFAALQHLHGAVPVVLITDGNPLIQHGKVAALGLDGLLDHVVVSDDLGGRALRKPHPAPFRAALALLDLPPSDVVHVGDRSAKDVAGAHGVGMRCIRVRTGEYGGVPDPADRVPWKAARSFWEAVELLWPLLETSRSGATPRLREQPGAPARL